MFRLALAAASVALSILMVPPARADIFESQSARGMCLNVAVGGSSIQPCNGSPIQDIAVTPVPEKNGDALLTSVGCLSMPRENDMIATINCLLHDGNIPQSIYFTLGDDGTISDGNLCFDIKGGGRKAGTKVIGFRCNGQINQRWIRQVTGTDVNSKIQQVGEARVKARLSVNSAPQLCLAPSRNGLAELQPCSTAPEMNYLPGGGLTAVCYLGKDAAGQVTALQCLSAQGTQGQQLQFQDAEINKLEGAYRWGLTDNGLLRNDSGLCADAKGKGNQPGTPVQLWKCHGNPNQRFTPIQ